MKHGVAVLAASAIAVSFAFGALAQDATWKPGDFGSVENLWAGSPHLQRQLASPTATWKELADQGLLESFPKPSYLDSPNMPRTADGLPNIFGEWEFHWARLGPQQADDERHLSAEEGDRILPEDFANDKMFEEWKTRKLADIPTNNCVPHHAPRIALRTSRMEVVRSAPGSMIDKVIFLHQQFNIIRKAYISYHPEPDLASRPNWGTSIGEWIDRSGDGQVDTFVMTTRGMEGSWIDQTGVTYETGATLTEEYWLNADGSEMIQHWILEDPKTYSHPIHHVQWFTRYTDIKDAVYDEYVCNLESARPELILQRYLNTGTPAAGDAATPAGDAATPAAGTGENSAK